MPSVIPDLRLTAKPGFASPRRTPTIGPGFALEYVELEAIPEFEFQTVGSAHYLALHDIVLQDGAARIEGESPSDLTDLRGTITFLPANVAISGWSRLEDRGNSFTALYFDPSLLDFELDDRYQAANVRPILYGRNPELETTLKKLQWEVECGTVDDLYVEHLCFAAALEALRLRPAQAVGALSSLQLSRALDFIREKYRDELNLSELAAVAGLSRFHFARAFKRSTGTNAFAYVRNVRLEKAVHLLTNSAAPVAIVAKECGFRDADGLRRALKALGTTPSRLRRLK